MANWLPWYSAKVGEFQGSATDREQTENAFNYLRKWNGTIISLIVILAIVLFFLLPANSLLLVTIYALLAVCVTLVGISWAIISFRIASPRGR